MGGMGGRAGRHRPRQRAGLCVGGEMVVEVGATVGVVAVVATEVVVTVVGGAVEVGVMVAAGGGEVGRAACLMKAAPMPHMPAAVCSRIRPNAL